MKNSVQTIIIALAAIFIAIGCRGVRPPCGKCSGGNRPPGEPRDRNGNRLANGNGAIDDEIEIDNEDLLRRQLQDDLLRRNGIGGLNAGGLNGGLNAGLNGGGLGNVEIIDPTIGIGGRGIGAPGLGIGAPGVGGVAGVGGNGVTGIPGIGTPINGGGRVVDGGLAGAQAGPGGIVNPATAGPGPIGFGAGGQPLVLESPTSTRARSIRSNPPSGRSFATF